MANLQTLVFFNPGGAAVNDVLVTSRLRFLDATETEILMDNWDDFPNSVYAVPALTRGLYRRDCTEYNDGNEWITIGPGGTTTRTDTLRRNGAVMFNYTEARLFVGAHTLIKRVVRRRQTRGLRTLVHYLLVQGHVW